MLVPVLCLLCVIAGALIWRNNHVKMEADIQKYKKALEDAESRFADVAKDAVVTAIKKNL